ncbi:aminoglycoside phosphotransferase family protein [Krasilnikovia sp. MM14-A1259]|uniref:aminoglycoside phosphotransferase family protein n=1 Tax=Krasilnikovia sp. MM14-A1259 TaxID=3373539 RepID=UPI003819967B
MKLPAGVTYRLTQHYGPSIRPWLASAPRQATEMAACWNVELDGFHDDGWTSVLAHGYTGGGQPVMMKLIPSQSRFSSELAALTHWATDGPSTVLHHDRAQRILLLRAIGGAPGGGPRPADHQLRVAAAMPSLHARPAPATTDLPALADNFVREIRPRLLAIHRRGTLGTSIPIDRLIRACEWSLRGNQTPVVLHADLYEANVLFDTAGVPVFIDPRGLRGPAAFDWAFWCAFYSPTGLDERLALAGRTSGIDRRLVLTWVAVVALNGLAHQINTDDRDGARRSLALLRTPAVQSHLREQP